MSETKFPLDESKLPFSIPRDAVPREKIVKLARKITDRIPAKIKGITVDDPEYWGLAALVTDEMADVALKMNIRDPKTLPELVKLTGKPAEELEPLLAEMSRIGLVEYNWENARREKQYSLPPFVPGSAGTCRRIKKSWERGRGLGEGRKPFSGKVPPLPQKRIHRLQLLHIGIPRAGLLKELGGAAGEGVRILDVAVEQQGGVEKALDHFGKLRIVWIGL